MPSVGGAPDLPEDVARLRAVDQVDAACRRGRERRARLEDEDRGRIAPAASRVRAPVEPDRRGRVVDARLQRLAREVGSDRGGRLQRRPPSCRR